MKTKWGEFELRRKNTVAVSVIKIKRAVTVRGEEISGGYSFIEHKIIPKRIVKGKIKPYLGTWCEHIITLDLKGKEIIPKKEIVPRRITDVMTLFDDASTREKHLVMDKWDIVCDDERNPEWEELESFIEFGKSYRVIIEEIV